MRIWLLIAGGYDGASVDRYILDISFESCEALKYAGKDWHKWDESLLECRITGNRIIGYTFGNWVKHKLSLTPSPKV